MHELADGCAHVGLLFVRRGEHHRGLKVENLRERQHVRREPAVTCNHVLEPYIRLPKDAGVDLEVR